MVYAGVGLGYRTSRHDLVNAESDYNQNWNEYINEFGEEDDAVIVVEGPGREQVVPVLEEISVALAREQNLVAARQHLGQALDLDPDYASAYVLLGRIHRAEQDPARAEVAFRQALDRDPSFADAHSLLGSSLLNKLMFTFFNLGPHPINRLIQRII